MVEQRILEEASRLPPGGAVTGWAALRLHGAGYFDGLAADGRSELPVPLVVPAGNNLRPRTGSTVHRERLGVGEVTLRHGVPVTAAPRAAFDAARRAKELRDAVVVLDMALSSGVVTPAQLHDDLTARYGWSGRVTVARALDLAETRSMSPAESRLRLIWVLDAELPAPRCNWPIADHTGRYLGRPDLLSETLAVVGEFDGAEHRTRNRQRDDVRRDESFRAVGLEPFRVVGADLGDPDLVIARIRSAVARAHQAGTPRGWQIQTNPRPVA